MDNSKQNQSNFLAAAVLSLLVLLVWSYFFAPKPVPKDNSDKSQAINAQTVPTQTPTSPPLLPAEKIASTPDTTPNRQITIKSPLYEAKLDSQGALATSWILLKNKSSKGEYPLFADGSTPTNQKPLQLISEEALRRNPREIPFRLMTPDQNLNVFINNRNYQVSTNEDTILLNQGEEKQIDFTLNENGIEVIKSFVFRADSNVADLKVSLRQNGQVVPDTRLLIGASIGDHAINHHSFYHIESETVAMIDGDITRHQGYYSFTYDANNQSSLKDKGTVDWAGVSDSYFAMIAIPAAPVQGLEYRASKYEVQTQPYYDGFFSWLLRSPKTSEIRHLVTTYVPISADGTTNKIYTGTKDYFLLSELNETLSQEIGRPIDIGNVINFSNYWWLRWMTKPLAIPILYALEFINKFTRNYGLAIIIFTFLFYSLLFPLRWSQTKSFKKAQVHAPKMQEIQQKIKDLQKKGVPLDDPRMRQLQMEQLRLMKGAVPLGGCLPMLLQFPLLIAFFTAVTVSLSIRQASFLWLPDLSASDPYHILEFAFAISMVISMKYMPTAPPTTPEAQMQQKMMTYLMPVMMIWVMWSAPSGLLLYWFFGNIVMFAQQLLINHLNKTDEPPKEEIIETMPKNVKKAKPKLSTS